MGQRHNARCAVLELLYAAEIGIEDKRSANFRYCADRNELNEDSSQFAESLHKTITDRLDEIDDILKNHIQNWDINRLAIVDKNILRIGVGELNFFPETPVKVAIDEAIELAKKYGSADSGRFVNGVLDAVCKDNDKSDS